VSREAYRRAGVDVETAEGLVGAFERLASPTLGPNVVSGIGGFASLYAMPPGLRDPLLVSSTDGVGTKLLLAQELGRYEGIGQDLVAMCVNDVAVLGAKPLFLLDYLATGRLDAWVVTAIVASIARACADVGCALLGGETAELPGMLAPGRVDVAGFCVGVVERDGVLGAHRVELGDALVAVPSSGVHANGLSWVRALLAEHGVDLHSRVPWGEGTVGDALLEPTRLYVRTLGALAADLPLRAAAHITGGGVASNLARVLPEHLAAELSPWAPPPVFAWLAELGRVDALELTQTLNGGVGLIVVAPAASAGRAAELAGGWVVGWVVERAGEPVVWRA